MPSPSSGQVAAAGAALAPSSTTQRAPARAPPVLSRGSDPAAPTKPRDAAAPPRAQGQGPAPRSASGGCMGWGGSAPVLGRRGAGRPIAPSLCVRPPHGQFPSATSCVNCVCPSSGHRQCVDTTASTLPLKKQSEQFLSSLMTDSRTACKCIPFACLHHTLGTLEPAIPARPSSGHPARPPGPHASGPSLSPSQRSEHRQRQHRRHYGNHPHQPATGLLRHLGARLLVRCRIGLICGCDLAWPGHK